MRAKQMSALIAPLLLAGCPDRTISGVPVEQTTVEVMTIPAVPNRDLDVLFVIDDSRSMEEEHASLKANFDRFIGVLESLDGGLPNVHIGVITPNLGTSATDGTTAGNLGGCAGQGDGGALHVLPGTSLRYLRDVEIPGGRDRNFTGTLTERFRELADVGFDGCGIEQHLESMKRALDGHPDNVGFLRREAYLAVIVIADEDDCSLASSSLFAGNPSEDRWGERVNFRCTTEGVACDSPGTELSVTGRREDCHPRFDSQVVTDVDRYVDFLKGLKADPRDLMVAGIVGDAGPFDIVEDDGLSLLGPSCTYPGSGGAQYAFPPIRTLDFISQFRQRAQATICDENLADGLTEIGAMIKAGIADPCFRSQLADVDPETPGAQYQCTVTDLRHRPNLPPEELEVIPACDPTRSRIPCWHVEDAPVECSYTRTNPHLKLVVERGGVVPPADREVSASCVTTASSGTLQ